MPDTPYVAIVDYEMSNLFSVDQACRHVGMPAVITSDPSVLSGADGIILPGVGAFAEAMSNLHRLKLHDVLLEKVASETLFMGVCLGLQLLLTESEEFGSARGLSVIDGVVRRFPSETEGRKNHIPQIAWNTIRAPHHDPDRWKETPLSSNAQDDHMYFVHSYYADVHDRSLILTETEYAGIRYCSGLRSGSVYAFQFHPEKSAVAGLKIYDGFFQLFKQRTGYIG